MAKFLAIGDLARVTGAKVNTIRYYEDAGLMPRPARTGSGRRTYDNSDVGRLGFIRHARSLGFATTTVRSLLRLNDDPDGPCGEVRAIASRHLSEIEARIESLKALQTELARMVADCDTERPMADCRTMEALAGPCQSAPDAKGDAAGDEGDQALGSAGPQPAAARDPGSIAGQGADSTAARVLVGSDAAKSV